ncbi:MAG TPA: hypothetical protein VK956_14705 [Verrucomicrobium sp.]|nr:hypothetical protein [Verrucomicrobium sp.]
MPITRELEAVYSQRPWTVVAAVISLGISFAMGLVSWLLTAHWEQPVVWLIYASVLAFFVLLLLAIYKGRGWARLLTIILVIWGLIWIPPVLRTPGWPIEKVQYVAQAVLQSFTVVLLLLPTTSAWYRLVSITRKLVRPR